MGLSWVLEDPAHQVSLLWSQLVTEGCDIGLQHQEAERLVFQLERVPAGSQSTVFTKGLSVCSRNSPCWCPKPLEMTKL